MKNFKRESATKFCFHFIKITLVGMLAVETDWSQEHQVGDSLLLIQVRDGGDSGDEEKQEC